MAGHKNFNELRKKMSPEQRARVSAEARAIVATTELAEIRNARGVTQEELAGRMEKRQPAVSTLERRDDVLVSSLREYVGALGGRLRLYAEFPDEEAIPIKQFDEEED